MVKLAGKLEMDLATTNNLCSQLLKYRNGDPPFNQPFLKSDDIIKWWASLEIEPPILQEFALRLFSICPNSASCERGFSTCGWISSKRRLKLGVERLESMVKLISYYRSNPFNELGFYGKTTNKDSTSQLDYSELIAIVNESLAEGDDDDDEDDTTQRDNTQRDNTTQQRDNTQQNTQQRDNTQRFTTDGHIIPNHEVRIFIEDTVNLLDRMIIQELGELLDDDEDDEENNNDKNEENLNEVPGKGVMNFNTDELINQFSSK